MNQVHAGNFSDICRRKVLLRPNHMGSAPCRISSTCKEIFRQPTDAALSRRLAPRPSLLPGRTEYSSCERWEREEKESRETWPQAPNRCRLEIFLEFQIFMERRSVNHLRCSSRGGIRSGDGLMEWGIQYPNKISPNNPLRTCRARPRSGILQDSGTALVYCNIPLKFHPGFYQSDNAGLIGRNPSGT